MDELQETSKTTMESDVTPKSPTDSEKNESKEETNTAPTDKNETEVTSSEILTNSTKSEENAKQDGAIENGSDNKNEVSDRGVPESSEDSKDNTQEEKERQSLNLRLLNLVSNDTNGENENGTKQEVREEKSIRRKRRKSSTSVHGREHSSEVKAKKLKGTNDKFCWRCHKESVDAQCSACPRSWHRKCIGGIPPQTVKNWICGECVTILKAENAETRSPSMAQLSVDQLCMLLKYIVGRMREYPGSEPFWKAVSLSEVPNYLDYVIKPMDLSLLESNVSHKLYGSTDAFMADAKWIQHNCIVFNTCGGVYADTSKLTNAAKQIIKVARQEVSEIEACPDCYAHGRNLPRPLPSWFIEPCRRPHPLVWAKLKGFPFWPAKAMPRLNGAGYVDVRFFGQHDRAWVPPKDLYLYSEQPPTPLPRKRKLDMDDCVREITRHCRKLELVFGEFKFAPPKVQYDPQDPMQIKLLLPNYDPTDPTIRAVPSLSASPQSAKKKMIIIRKRGPYKKAPLDHSNDNNDTTLVRKYIAQKNSTSASNKDKQRGNSRISALFNNTTVRNSIKSRKSQSLGSNVDKDSSNKSVPPEGSDFVQSKANAKTSVSHTHDINKQPVLKLKNKDAEKPSSPPVPPFSGNSSNSNPKSNKATRIYKPKTKMVDKVNAENALISEQNLDKAVEISSDSSSSVILSPRVSTLRNNNLSSSFEKTVNHGLPSELNNVTVKEEPKEGPQQCDPSQPQQQQKKESKARKSFPNRPPSFPQARSLLKGPTNNSTDPMVYIPGFVNDNIIDPPSYELLPPEAGPVSAELNRGAQELVKKMAQIMEEALKDAAARTSDSNCQEDGSNNNREAIIYSLRLQNERMRWQHQQQIAELKHNTDRMIREIRASSEAERLRAIEEVRKEAEMEKLRCIEETKRKQWCAMCGREAMFYCCWNTAYCDSPCQQAHWPSHMRTCAQQSTFNSVVTSTASNSNSQVMPRLVISAQNAKLLYGVAKTNRSKSP